MLFGLIALLALVLQTSILPVVSRGMVTPDLLLILCVYLGLHEHSVAGAMGAFVLGYLEDAFSGSAVGLNAFGMSLVFVTVYLTSRRLWVDNAISKIVLVFLAAALKAVVILALLTVFLSVDAFWQAIAGYLVLEAVVAAVLSPAVFAVLGLTPRLAEAEEE